MDFSIFMQPENWIALLTLTFLEIVLGIDNIIFISILTNKLPEDMRPKARSTGIGLALLFRIVMLLGINWIIGFTQPLVEASLFGYDLVLSGRDLILILGGLFLLTKSTREIHHKIDHDKEEDEEQNNSVKKGMTQIVLQIALLDIVFSFDSILTAVGIAEHVLIMIIAVIISLLVMLAFAGKISAFIEKYPTLQMLALSFLILIGVMLIADGFGQHVSKGYIYFAVGFSLLVEVLNIKTRKKKSTTS